MESSTKNVEKNVKILYIAFSIIILVFCIILVKKTFPNDIFFSIRMGEDVIKSGIDNLDSLTIHEDLYFEHLRWGFDLLSFCINKIFGNVGIHILVIGIFSITALCIFNILYKKKIGIIVSFLITFAYMFFVSKMFVARAQIISYLCFLLEVYFIEKLIKTNNKKYTIYLFLISIIIVNFHASIFPMYFILYLPFIAEYILYLIVKKINILRRKYISKNDDIKSEKFYKVIFRNYNFKYLVIALLLGIIGGFLSPSFVASYTYMFKCAGAYSTNIINELQTVELPSSPLILIVLQIFVLNKILVDKKYIYLIGLFIIPIVWINMYYNSFILFFVLYIPYILEGISYLIVSKLLKKETEYKRISINKISIVVLLICVLIGIIGMGISPNGFSIYNNIFRLIGMYFKYGLVNINNTFYSENGGMIIIMAVFILTLILKNVKMNASNIFMIFGLLVLPFLARRNVTFIYLIFPLCLSEIIVENVNIKEYLSNIDRRIISFKYKWTIYFLFVIGTSFIFYENMSDRIKEGYINEENFPVKATNYILENLDCNSIRIYNQLNYGSYLEMYEVPTFIDSRNEIYCEEFNDVKILVDEDDTENLKIEFEKIFEKYDISYLVLKSNSTLTSKVSVLDTFGRIYYDDNFVIFKKLG